MTRDLALQANMWRLAKLQLAEIKTFWRHWLAKLQTLHLFENEKLKYYQKTSSTHCREKNNFPR